MALPDGPGLNPVELIRFIREPLAFFRDNAARYGDPFRLRFPGVGTFVITGDPAAIREIFTAPVDTFSVGNPDLLGPVLGANSMLMISGPEHRRQRQLLAPPFHGKRMRAYATLMCEVTERVTAAWHTGQEVNAVETMQAITMGVIVRAIFGVTDPERAATLEKLLREVIDSVGPLILFAKSFRRDLGPRSPWGNFIRLREKYTACVREEVQKRRASTEERDDILALMLAARDEAGQPMSEQEILDELATLLVAGHETTAASLAWALYFLHREPRILEVLHRELDALDPAARPEAFASAPYLGAVIQEALRLHPAIPETNRRVNDTFTLKGHELPAGTIVTAAMYLLHHDPAIYPQPEHFRPERFLERKFAAHEYAPFGGGARRCIGYAFAEYEMKMVLGTLCSQLDLRLAEEQRVTVVRRNLAITPSGGVRLIVCGRRAPRA